MSFGGRHNRVSASWVLRKMHRHKRRSTWSAECNLGSGTPASDSRQPRIRMVNGMPGPKAKDKVECRLLRLRDGPRTGGGAQPSRASARGVGIWAFRVLPASKALKISEIGSFLAILGDPGGHFLCGPEAKLSSKLAAGAAGGPFPPPEAENFAI